MSVSLLWFLKRCYWPSNKEQNITDTAINLEETSAVLFQVTCTFILLKAEIKPSYPQPFLHDPATLELFKLSRQFRADGEPGTDVRGLPEVSFFKRKRLSSTYVLDYSSSCSHSHRNQQDIDPSKACLYVSLLWIITRSPNDGCVVFSNEKGHKVLVSS